MTLGLFYFQTTILQLSFTPIASPYAGTSLRRKSGWRDELPGAEPSKDLDFKTWSFWTNRVYGHIYGVFLKWWYPTTMGFPTKNDHFGGVLGVPPFKETSIWVWKQELPIHKLDLFLDCHSFNGWFDGSACSRRMFVVLSPSKWCYYNAFSYPSLGMDRWFAHVFCRFYPLSQQAG